MMTEATNDWETVEIARKDRPDIRFEGRLIDDISSRDESRQTERKKDRWTELAVYELRSGNWAVCLIACSDKDDEIDFGDCEVVTWQQDESAMRRAVIANWNWTWLAKALADKAGWDVVEELS
jgi:hypothetical protein